MKNITVVLPTVEDAGSITQKVSITAITDIGTKIIKTKQIKVAAIQGPVGPGIESNITRITASVDPPSDPEENDLWIDLN